MGPGDKPASAPEAGLDAAGAGPGAEAAFPDDAIEVARVVGAFGVKGDIKVKPLSRDPQALFSSKRWFLQAPSAGAGPGPKRPTAALSWPRLLRVVRARMHTDHVVASVHDLQDRDAAEALAGARLFVSRASFPTPEADEFYWVDLIGTSVINREGLRLGTVAGLLETGPVCLLRIEGNPQPDNGADAATGELLIPFVSAYVDRVDLPLRCIHVDWQPDY
ncbi:MAG: ribosome maturation factor RimM [Rubrivivax sp.]|nr:ribosome maturation factor RimM [Rubrivivax sp.]